MKLPSSHRSNMRHCAIPRRLMFPADFQLPSPSSSPDATKPQTVYDAWLTSREMPGKHGVYLVPGATRALTLRNTWLALFVCQTCILDFVCFIPNTLSPKKLTIPLQFKVLWILNPLRTTLMMALNIIRSVFPAFRGYSQVCHKPHLSSGLILMVSTRL